jgi:hypothetical protein
LFEKTLIKLCIIKINKLYLYLIFKLNYMNTHTHGGNRKNSGRKKLSWKNKRHSIVLFIKGADITNITGYKLTKGISEMKKYFYSKIN